MPELSKFLQDELDRRGWSIPDFVKRAQKHGRFSQSNAYLIIRDGEDNIRQKTFDLIAATLNMSPAELHIAIGKGPATADPRLAPIHAALRDVPHDALDMVETVVRSLRVESAHGAKRRTAASDNSQPPTGAEQEQTRPARPLRKDKHLLRPASGHGWYAFFGSDHGQTVRALLAQLHLNRDSLRAFAPA